MVLVRMGAISIRSSQSHPRPHLLLVVFSLWMLLGGASTAKIHGNPANDLVEVVNAKRTATNSKLRPLHNSAGLGCMALQYIGECISINGAGACGGDNVNATDTVVACEPPEAHITEVYAANCGVELPTVDVISGRLIGCHRGGEQTALDGKKAAAVVGGKEHTQVGAGLDRARRHGPFFWCLLFSSGAPNSTFLLDAGGRGIQQTHGCFSAPDRLSCAAAATPPQRRHAWLAAAAVVLLSLR